MSQQAAKRRRKQAANNYAHLAPKQRPNYKKRSLAASTAHEARKRITAQRIAQGKNKSKK